MKFFLDTANVKEIQEAASLGLLDGVTTNPSLVAKEGRSFKEMLIEICNIVDGGPPRLKNKPQRFCIRNQI